MNRPHFLYRCYDADGLLLYIGLTVNPRKRMQVHMAHRAKASLLLQCYMTRWEVDADAHPSLAAGREAEAAAIAAERPLFNTQDVRRPLWLVMRDHLAYINDHAPNGSEQSRARLAEYVRQIEAHINCDADYLGMTARERKEAVLIAMSGGVDLTYSPFVRAALERAA